MPWNWVPNSGRGFVVADRVEPERLLGSFFAPPPEPAAEAGPAAIAENSASTTAIHSALRLRFVPMTMSSSSPASGLTSHLWVNSFG